MKFSPFSLFKAKILFTRQSDQHLRLNDCFDQSLGKNSSIQTKFTNTQATVDYTLAKARLKKAGGEIQ